jgi:hypothetical protein
MKLIITDFLWKDEMRLGLYYDHSKPFMHSFDLIWNNDLFVFLRSKILMQSSEKEANLLGSKGSIFIPKT